MRVAGEDTGGHILGGFQSCGQGGSKGSLHGDSRDPFPELSHAFSHRDNAVPAPRQDLTLSKDEVSKFPVLLYI